MKEILITSSVLIAVLLLLRVIFAKKVSRVLIYGAWALVALRLLIPVQIGEIDFSILTSAKPVTEAITQIEQRPVSGQTKEEVYQDIVADYIEKDQTVFIPEVQEQIKQEISQGTVSREEILDKIQQARPNQDIFVPEVQQQVQQQVEETADPITLGQIANIVWLAGVAVMAVWFMVVNLRHSRMLLKNRKKLECDSPIPVYVSEKVGSPCLVGLFRPAIYLTPECAASEETMRHVLTHELTHYAHKDHIWSVVRCICLCVYWFDPLVWVAAWFSRRDCELACDEGALKRLGPEERIAYGMSLLDVVSHASTPANLMQTATAMNETKKQLKERVNFIVKKPKISLIAAICMVIVCAIVAGCAAAGPATMGTPTTNPATSTPTQPTTSKPADGSGSMKWIQLLTTVKKGNAIITELTYDEQWNLKGVVGNSKYRIEIDAVNRTMKVYLPEGGDFLQEEYQYDAAGNLTMIKCYGETAYTEEFIYDADGKIVKEILFYETPEYMAGQRWETVYKYYGETEKIKAKYVYTCYENSIGQNVRNEAQSVFYSYDAWGNLSREDWYRGNGEKLQYVLYTFNASQRSEKREVFIERGMGEGVADILEEMSIQYYNAEGNVIRREEYETFGMNLEHTYTYTYQAVQVPENFFAPKYVNHTERKVVFPDNDSQPVEPLVPQKVTYTVKAVDTRGNPVAGVPIVKCSDLENVFLTDENGMFQWEDYEREMPFYPPVGQIPDGYAYSGYTQDGNVYTILMRPIVTYTIRVLKEDGKPFANASVSLSGSLEYDSKYTDVNGILTLSLPEDHYEVKIDNLMVCDDGEEIWTQKYEIVEGQTEATFIWVDDTVNYKVKVVDKNGNPVSNVEVDIWVEDMDGAIPTVRTDKNGEAIFKVRVRQYTIYLYIIVIDDSVEGGCRVFSYGTFAFSGDEKEIVIEVGEPKEVEANP